MYVVLKIKEPNGRASILADPAFGDVMHRGRPIIADLIPADDPNRARPLWSEFFRTT